MASFVTDLKYTELARSRLEEFYYPTIAYCGQFVSIGKSAGSLWLQRNAHIDVIMATKKDGSVTVEEKIVRWLGWERDCIMIETHSDYPELDGWIAVSKADYLLYGFQLEDRRLSVWVFDLPKLRAWFQPIENSYKIVDTQNRDWLTRCRLVPLKDIPVDCVKAKNKIV